jgi:hypothetical protein
MTYSRCGGMDGHEPHLLGKDLVPPLKKGFQKHCMPCLYQRSSDEMHTAPTPFYENAHKSFRWDCVRNPGLPSLMLVICEAISGQQEASLRGCGEGTARNAHSAPESSSYKTKDTY